MTGLDQKEASKILKIIDKNKIENQGKPRDFTGLKFEKGKDWKLEMALCTLMLSILNAPRLVEMSRTKKQQ